jgi:hypothetical protein
MLWDALSPRVFEALRAAFADEASEVRAVAEALLNSAGATGAREGSPGTGPSSPAQGL